jgi:glycosyltransferase involved in cell wall biosynthesis
MKLLIYSHYFAPSIGGVETIVLGLARGLAGVRHPNGAPEFEVTLVTQTPAGGCDDAAWPFRVVRQAGFLELSRFIRACDVLHIAGPAFAPLLLARLFGKKVVVEQHGFQTICPNGQLLIETAGGTPCPGHFMAGRHGECLRCNASLGWLGARKLWLMTFVRRFLCARVSANIAPTKWLGDLLRLPKTVAIPHGLAQIAALPRPEALPARPVITFLGRLVSTKGVRVLFEAASELRRRNRSFELLIVGDGPERASLEKLARGLGLNGDVRFAGRLPAHQLNGALADSFAVAIPSLGGEVFGLVVAENMMRALPVVVSDLGAFAEVVGDAGLVFKTGDAADLAAKISQLLDDPKLAATLAEHGRKRALDFCSLPKMLDAHAALYRELVRAPNSLRDDLD